MDINKAPITRFRNPIFILGSHKSGTSLLRSLLDGHSSLSVIPTETHFFELTGHMVHYALRRSMPANYSKDEIRHRLIDYVKRQNNDKNPYSDLCGFSGYDVDRLIRFLDRELPDSRRDLFELYITALYYAFTGNSISEHSRIVEKSVEQAEHATLLRKYFPDSQFLHIIRNPYATLVAIRKVQSRRRYPDLRRIVSSMHNSYSYLYSNSQALDGYHVIKYEDLVSDTEGVMRRICQDLGIGYEEQLITPTSAGVPWRGNSTSDVSFQGISSSPLYNWEKEINSLEIHLVNRFAVPVMKQFGYETIKPLRKYFFPVKGEKFDRYFRNRSLLTTLDRW